MSGRATLLVWAGLLLLVGIEFLAAHASLGTLAAPVIGLAMAALVAFTFMRLAHAPSLAKVFTLAGLFWLCVMMGLGSLDSATRQDIRITTQTHP